MTGDTLSPEQRSERMGRVRNKDTRPELLVRRLVYSLGYRYRLHSRTLPGHPDLVFARLRRVIFVHGCFWHRHDDANCPLARLPKSRLDFWVPKLEGNRARDEANQGKLRALGWQVLVVWECQLRDKDALASKLREFLKSRQ
jgi:DNA mismatch endonuclease (patch repair protein)